MLILKEKFLFSKFCAVVGELLGAVLMLAALTWMGTAQVQAAPLAAEALPARAPAVVATDFYNWYLDTMRADQDPLSDRHATFNNYVARELTARLVANLSTGKLPERDYFLQSPGYDSGWPGHVAAATVRQRGTGADVIVTLGQEGGARRVLALAMVLEAGSWKIRQVVLVEARTESSPDKSVI